LTNERTSAATHENLSFSLVRSSERSWFDDVDSTELTAVTEVIPGVVLAQVGNAIATATKPRTTVV